MMFVFRGDRVLQYFLEPSVPTIDKVVNIAEAVKTEKVGDDDLLYPRPIRFLEAKFGKVMALFRNC